MQARSIFTCVSRDVLLKDSFDPENYVENIIKGVEEMEYNYGYIRIIDNEGNDETN